MTTARTRVRLVIVIVVLLALIGAGVLVILDRISRQQAEETLARQAEEIAAHRQAQRAEPPVTPAVCPRASTTSAPVRASQILSAPPASPVTICRPSAL